MKSSQKSTSDRTLSCWRSSRLEVFCKYAVLKHLTYFSPMSHFYTPWKSQKTIGFLTFSEGIEMWHWTKRIKTPVSHSFFNKVAGCQLETLSKMDTGESVFLLIYCEIFRSSRPEVFCKKVFLNISQNSQENTRAKVPFLIKRLSIKKQTLPQVFSCEFCEIFKNTFFIEHTSDGCFWIFQISLFIEHL